MSEKRMNKKGQEGITIGTLLLILLGAVVVVVIILGATGSLNFIFNKIKVAPGQDLQAVVTSCEIAAKNELRADYCLTFKEVEIDGVDQYVTCDYDRIESVMSPDVTPLTCSDSNSGTDYCKTLRNNERSFDPDKTLVNGKTCTSLGVEKLKCGDITIGTGESAKSAEWVANKDACKGQDVTNKVVDKEGKTTEVCCLPSA